MFTERIKALASLVDKEDSVVDIGCDHGYLSIYLKQNNLCKNICASDISKKALEYAINNFKKYKLDINTYVSDGFNNIEEYYDTAVIAGMGSSTILSIINNNKCPNKLILGSNNDLYKLRTNLYKMNFYIEKELCILDSNHYYSIMLVRKGNKKISKKYLMFGLSKNIDYYKYLLNKNKELIKKVPLSKKINLYKENYYLKKLIKESRII